METKTITIDSANINLQQIKHAAAIVDVGGLVVFPTETVYGIASIVSEAAFLNLDEAKGRPGDKRYTLHIPTMEDITKYIPTLNFRTCKLIDNAWPGPLTIIFELSEDDLAKQKKRLSDEIFKLMYQKGTIGVRCPDNPIAKALLSACKNPVVAPSANLSGQKPAITSKMALSQLDGRVDMIISPKKESDACGYQINSTIVKISSGDISIIRDGAIENDEIDKMSQVRLLFVCTGNTCRSPMAEYLCKKYIAEKLNCNLDELQKKGYKVISAGVFGMDNAPASSEVIDICNQRGIDAKGHGSKVLTAEMVEESDVIFAMTAGHLDGIVSKCPNAESKCFLLNGNKDIPDPIGGGMDVYIECARIIEQALDNRLCEMMI